MMSSLVSWETEQRTNLLCISQVITTTFDSHSQVDISYTDISKAFNKLDHTTFIRKLQLLGSVSLFYKLSNCSSQGCWPHWSCIQNIHSHIRDIPVLGPLFLNRYNNDIGNIFGVDHLWYTDDFFQFRNSFPNLGAIFDKKCGCWAHFLPN